LLNVGSKIQVSHASVSNVLADNQVTISTTLGTDFQTVSTTDPNQLDHTFTVTNTGDADLNFLGAPSRVYFNGGDSDHFFVSRQPDSAPVSPSGIDTFVIRFNPFGAGGGTVRSTTVHILNDDASYGAGNPFDFVIQGTVSGVSPEFLFRFVGFC
jgi:hypothetical protein